MLSVAIVGSRDFQDYPLLEKVLNKILKPYKKIQIISGGAKGADNLAAHYANNKQINLIEILPDWDKHGKSAGFIRNSDIIKNADLVLSFWNGHSRGTMEKAKKLKKKMYLILYNENQIIIPSKKL